MEPHRVIEARHLQSARVEAEPERQDRRVEQGHVARIGDDAGVQYRVVGKPAVRAHPHPLPGRLPALPPDGSAVLVAEVDRPGTVVPVADLVGVGRHPFLERRQFVGVSETRGHLELVREPGLLVVEAGLEVEDRAAVLDRDDPAGGEAASVADPVDVVENRDERVAGAQEVGVQRVHQPTGIVDRARRRDEGLTGNLAAEHALAVLVGGTTAEEVHLDRLEVEEVDQVVERTLVHRGRHVATARCGSAITFAAALTRNCPVALSSRCGRWETWVPGRDPGSRSRRATRVRDCVTARVSSVHDPARSRPR